MPANVLGYSDSDRFVPPGAKIETVSACMDKFYWANYAFQPIVLIPDIIQQFSQFFMTTKPFWLMIEAMIQETMDGDTFYNNDIATGT